MRRRVLVAWGSAVAIVSACGGTSSNFVGGPSGDAGSGSSGSGTGGGSSSGGSSGTGSSSSGGASSSSGSGSTSSGGGSSGGSSGGGSSSSGGSSGDAGGASDASDAASGQDGAPTCAACSGGTCVGAVCRLVHTADGGVPAVGDFSCLAVDSQNVYVATGLPAANGGQIYVVPLSGGTPTTIVPSQAQPHGIASDGTNVFWADYNAAGSGSIMKAGTNGSNPTPIVTGLSKPLNVALLGGQIFWNDVGDGTVWQANKDGSGQIRLASNVTVNTTGYVAAGGGTVYYPDPVANGSVYGVVTGDAGAPQPEATMQTRPTGVAVDGTDLFWSDAPTGNSTGGSIKQLTLGQTTVSTLAMGLNAPNAVATDGTNVYWSEANAAGAIKRVPAGGGTVTTLASAQNWPSCIALDATSVYWINSQGGAISKTAK